VQPDEVEGALRGHRRVRAIRRGALEVHGARRRASGEDEDSGAQERRC
jgi:hypothetical protein